MRLVTKIIVHVFMAVYAMVVETEPVVATSVSVVGYGAGMPNGSVPLPKASAYLHFDRYASYAEYEKKLRKKCAVMGVPVERAVPSFAVYAYESKLYIEFAVTLFGQFTAKHLSLITACANSINEFSYIRVPYEGDANGKKAFNALPNKVAFANTVHGSIDVGFSDIGAFMAMNPDSSTPSRKYFETFSPFLLSLLTMTKKTGISFTITPEQVLFCTRSTFTAD